MPEAHGYLKAFLNNLKRLREAAGLNEAELEEQLILGPGWIGRFERGETTPSIDMVLAILHATNATFDALLEGLPEAEPEPATVERCIYAEQSGDDTIIYFEYAKHDAQYRLHNSTLFQFETVIKTLRDGLARLSVADTALVEAVKSDSVARAFLQAVALWPHASPSDIWWFLIYRAYCDPYNHPAKYARLDFTQSWKRTGGWALEEVFVRHYGPHLKQYGISMSIGDLALKKRIVEELGLKDRVEADKIDIILTGDTPQGPRFFGMVNVKASFAERRTDDVPLSQTMIANGFTAPLLTMDCKSSPGVQPVNRGELGKVQGSRSAKRMDIEDEGFFSGCFSYNRRTEPSPATLVPERRVYVCDFVDPDDAFSQFIRHRWRVFQTAERAGGQ